MMLTGALCLVGTLTLAFGQQITPPAGQASVVIEQRNPNVRDLFYNTTLEVPVDQLSSSPAYVVDPKMLFHFYVLAAAPVTCTPFFDTVPATPFPTVVGASFTNRSPATPPEAAANLNEAKVRFFCTSKLSAGQARAIDTSAAQDPKVATILRGALDGALEGSNVSYTIPVGQPAQILSVGASRFYLAGTTGIDVNAVSCTPTWEQEPLRQTSGEFALTVSSFSPVFVSSKSPANVTIFCKDHLEDGSGTDLRQPSAGTADSPATVPSRRRALMRDTWPSHSPAKRQFDYPELYDQKKCPAINGPVGAIQNCHCYHKGLLVNKFVLEPALAKACDQISQWNLGPGYAHYGVNFPVADGDAQVRVYSREYGGAPPPGCDVQVPYLIPRDVCVNAFRLMVDGCPYDGDGYSTRGAWAVDQCFLWVMDTQGFLDGEDAIPS